MRKNIIKISAIALLSAFALTSCSDDIIAKPTGYDDKNSPVVTILNDDGSPWNGTVVNNTFTSIYDSIRSGALASNVLDELLYQYSISVFGNYNKITAKKITNNPYGEITLKAAVNSYRNGDKKDADAFINAHSAYWVKDANGDRVVKDNKPSASEYARLDQKWVTIEERIAKKMYGLISGGSYSERNVFEEERFLQSLSADFENNVRSLSGAQLFTGILTSAVEDVDVFEKETDTLTPGTKSVILHRENYQSKYKLTDVENPEVDDATYVEDKIIPDIYRQLLVEQYIIDESYNTLGRTSARQIDVLSISKSDNYAKGAVNLMNEFINSRIFKADRAATDPITLDDFKVVSNAWIGAFMSTEDYGNHSQEYTYMKNAVGEYEVTTGAKPYFRGTAYGDMMEEIEKINENPKLSENESAYTGNNEYTKEIGEQIKTRELQLKDYTFTGWYVKSVGVSGLPDSIKNQLFDINVANALNGSECVKYEYNSTDKKWETNNLDIKKTNVINVVGEVNGQYFLRNTSRIKGNPVQSDLLFESDGTYYIVLVQDAIRSKNLDRTNPDAAKLENYINEIVQIVADNDTYKTLSKKHWIEKMDLKHHDSVVYTYFKTTFPELFD